MEDSDEFLGFENESSREEESTTQLNEENSDDSSDSDGDDQSSDIDDENRGNDSKKRAPVWKHFTEVVDENGNKYAKCKHFPCTVKDFSYFV